MPSSSPLPPKESAIFRKILKCYEMKQYKNGLKLAKQILTNPKFTEHGETLAMKGLTLNCLGRKDEAYDHVRRGLRNDLRSHVCWHVYGLLQRSDKKYDEAIKCYRNALKWEKDNIQILRDLSLLQIQMRDLEGYRETRHQLFKLRPNQHASWIGFAMSYHLLGDYDTAISILETFEASQTVETFDYKHSELLLYQNQVIRESENYENALKHLEAHAVHIFDKLTLKETKGELCLKLKRHEEAAKIYGELIDRNPENTLYYGKFIEAKQLTDTDEILAMYKGFQDTYSHSICPKRLPLNVASGDTFRQLVDQFLRRNLRKGVPPLFVNVRSLYRDRQKVQIIQDLVHEYHDTLKRSGYFSAADEARASTDTSVTVEPASALLWTLYYLAQHYDHLRDTQLALKFINEAIDHTPTLIELFVTKGRIYKHAGDVVEAFKWLDEAQSLDTADRYINSKCAKYMLRANKVKEAEEICAKFTREGVPAIENLNEMQCMWFQTECALAFQRLEKWGDSLKKCHEIDRHFSEIIEDQFDFHTYCMRKMTLRSYVDLLRLEDVLRQHPFYFKAAQCAIEVYVRLFDQPLEADSTIEESALENLPPSELKKLRNKQRKAKKKAELESQQQQQAQVKKEQHNKSRQQQNQDAGDPEAPQLDELIAEKLERPEAPLEKATDFLRPLQLLAKGNIETHLMAFEIYVRKNKPLLMLQALKRAQKLEPANARLHFQIVQFNKYMEANGEQLNGHVKSVIGKGVAALCGGKSLADFNAAYLEANRGRCESVLSATVAMAVIEPARKEEACGTLLDTKIDELTLENCLKIQDALTEHFAITEDQMKEFANKCREKFPYALKFLSASLGQSDEADNLNKEDSKQAINDLKEPATDQQITVA